MIDETPVTYILQRLVRDPATIKLATAIFSLVLIISLANHGGRNETNVPLLVAVISSFLYSILAILVVIFKKQECIENCGILKKVFRGRNVFWHEFQASAAFALAVANTTGLVLCGDSSDGPIRGIFAGLNVIFFSIEWYLASDSGKSYVSEENPKLGHSCLECIFGLFHGFPFFFNVVRKGCLIAALVMIATDWRFDGYRVSYYIFCLSVAIAGSFLLFVLQASGTLENSISSKLVSGRKWHTYLMLIVLVHAFFASLSITLVNQDVRESYTVKVPRTRNPYDYYNNNGYNNGYYDRYNGYRGRDRYGSYNTATQSTTTTTESPPIWYESTSYRYYSIWAPIDAPIPFALSWVVVILAILDLYVRAISSRSRRDSDITAPLTDNTNSPFSGGVNKCEDFNFNPSPFSGGVNKVEDLPFSIATPHHFEQQEKPFYI